MKKHFKVLEYMLIIVLLLYGAVYLFSYSTDNYPQDDIALGFYLVKVSLGHGFTLIAISYLTLKVSKKWIALVLTVINGVVACMLIGFSDFDLKTAIFGDNIPYIFKFGNTLIRLGYVKKDVINARFNYTTSVTKCNIAEVICVIIQVAIVIITLYSLFIMIRMFNKHVKNEIEAKKEYVKGKYTSLLRNINILLGLVFVAIIIYIVVDFCGTHCSKEVLHDTMMEVFSTYLIPTIFLFIITDLWITRGDNIKLLIFYVMYVRWSYLGITDFIVGAHYDTLGWIYAILVGLTTMTVFFKIICSIRDRGKITTY